MATTGETKADRINQKPNPPQVINSFLGAQILLRILLVGTTLGASWVMVTSSESATVFGFDLDARYSYSSAFKFFVLGNAIACAFAVISLLLMVLLISRCTGGGGGIWTSSNNMSFVIFLHDLSMMSLVLAACGAATAIGEVGKHGNSHAGWVPICDQFHNFCHKVTISLVLSYLSFLMWLTLTVLDAFKIKIKTTATVHLQA